MDHTASPFTMDWVCINTLQNTLLDWEQKQLTAMVDDEIFLRDLESTSTPSGEEDSKENMRRKYAIIYRLTRKRIIHVIIQRISKLIEELLILHNRILLNWDTMEVS